MTWKSGVATVTCVMELRVSDVPAHSTFASMLDAAVTMVLETRPLICTELETAHGNNLD